MPTSLSQGSPYPSPSKSAWSSLCVSTQSGADRCRYAISSTQRSQTLSPERQSRRPRALQGPIDLKRRIPSGPLQIERMSHECPKRNESRSRQPFPAQHTSSDTFHTCRSIDNDHCSGGMCYADGEEQLGNIWRQVSQGCTRLTGSNRRLTAENRGRKWSEAVVFLRLSCLAIQLNLPTADRLRRGRSRRPQPNPAVSSGR